MYNLRIKNFTSLSPFAQVLIARDFEAFYYDDKKIGDVVLFGFLTREDVKKAIGKINFALDHYCGGCHFGARFLIEKDED